MLGVLEAGFISCSWKILGKGVGRSREMNDLMWRYLSIRARYLAVLRWCRDESQRSAATRRHTLRTGADVTSEYLEKSGCFAVKNANKWCVFQCTVNWARARHSLAFIARGAQRSSSFYAAGVRECAAAGGGSSVLQANADAGGSGNADRSRIAGKISRGSCRSEYFKRCESGCHSPKCCLRKVRLLLLDQRWPP